MPFSLGVKICPPSPHFRKVRFSGFFRSVADTPACFQKGSLVFCASLAFGCTALLGDGKGDPSSEVDPDDTAPKTPTPENKNGMLSISREAVETACSDLGEGVAVGVTKLRRLSVLEFNNTVQSLLGGPYIDYAPDLPDDEPMGPFVSNQSLAVGSQEARKYRTVAEQVAEAALAGGTAFLPCSLPQGSETECIEQFLREFTPRAFRRSVSGEEVAAFLELYVLGRDGLPDAGPDPTNGLRLLLRGLVGSPDLLYIVDTGENGVPGQVPEAASAHTLASRLSLAFWNAPPDAELLGLADSGQLLSAEIYAEQVTRVLSDSRARTAIAHFFAQLTGVSHLQKKLKDPLLFPEWSEALVGEMLAEQADFVTTNVFDGDGSLDTLFLTNHTSPGPLVASIYGVPATVPVSLPAAQRQGIFTQPAYLAAHNKPAETSPVHLGINIREAILCETMDPPPPGVDTSLPKVSGEIKTSRDRFLAHETGPCKNCHELIDPIGLAFEHYDAIGRYRETDGGAPIDPSGQIISSSGGEDGPMFTGALELSQQLADSLQVQDCFSRQMLRAVLDRQESLRDACSALEVIEGFEDSGGHIIHLLAQIAQTKAFTHIVLNPPPEAP